MVTRGELRVDYMKSYRVAHRNEHATTQREYRIKNLEKLREKQRFYNIQYKIRNRKRYLESKLISEAKRRTHKLGSTGVHSINEWKELKQKYKNICPMCFKAEPTIKLTEDHIIPLSVGGSNDISNIQPLCKSCNSRKRTKTIFFPSLG